MQKSTGIERAGENTDLAFEDSALARSGFRLRKAHLARLLGRLGGGTFAAYVLRRRRAS